MKQNRILAFINAITFGFLFNSKYPMKEQSPGVGSVTTVDKSKYDYVGSLRECTPQVSRQRRLIRLQKTQGHKFYEVGGG